MGSGLPKSGVWTQIWPAIFWGLDSNCIILLGSGLKSWGLDSNLGVWTQISVDKVGSVLTIKPKVGFVLNSDDGF